MGSGGSREASRLSKDCSEGVSQEGGYKRQGSSTRGGRSSSGILREDSDKQLEEHFLDHPYVAGFRPSAADRELYDKLSTTTGKPSTLAFGRWYTHVGSFKSAQRAEWK